MKRLVAFVLTLALVLISGASTESNILSFISSVSAQENAADSVIDATEESESFAEVMELREKEPSFGGLNDPELLSYVENNVYSNLVQTLASENYFVENVEAIYISQEYIDELIYNSQSNVFFGYTLEELNQQFQGERYVFTLGDNGETTV